MKNKDEFDITSEAMRRINKLLKTIQDGIDSNSIQLASEVNTVAAGNLPTRTITFVISDLLLDRWRQENDNKAPGQ